MLAFISNSGYDKIGLLFPKLKKEVWSVMPHKNNRYKC